MNQKGLFFTGLCLSLILGSTAQADIYKGFEQIGSGNIVENSTPGNSRSGLQNTLLSILLNGPEGSPYEVSLPAGPHVDVDLSEDPSISSFQRNFKLRIKHQANKNKAHLVFVIPGFGASCKKGVAPYLSEFLNKNGFVTASINSPANPEFIMQSHSIGVPGNQKWDAQDIYDMIHVAKPQIESDFGYTFEKVSVIGASLGSMNAFHIAGIDLANQRIKHRKSIDFHRVISINPPISNVYGATAIDTFVAKSTPGTKDFNWKVQFDTFTNALASVGLIILTTDQYDEVPAKSQQTLNNLNASGFDDTQLKFLVGFAFAPTVRKAIIMGEERADLDAEGTGISTIQTFPVEFFTGFFKRYSFRNMWAKYVHGSVMNYKYDIDLDTGAKIPRLKDKYSFDEMMYPHFNRTEDESIGKVLPDWQKSYEYDLSSFYLITWHDDFLLRNSDPEWIEDTLSGGKMGNGKVFYNGGGHLGGFWQPEFQKYLLEALK